MPFNEGQLKAIQQRNASILVSAPAGSGKTKILVSRIVELLKEGWDIFDFLVLTFTEAAGNEMKQRLTQELNELVNKDIDSSLKEHLLLQIEKLPHAYITNFHGFCNLLLNKYGYLVNVMPGFSINSDPTQIKKEVLRECEEKWILNEEFQNFLSLYFPSYSLDEFESLLLEIDNLSHSIDNFYGYIEEMKSTYYDSLSLSLQDWPLFPYLKSLFVNELNMSYCKLIELKAFCEENSLIDFYERPDEQSEKNQLLPTPFDSMYEYIDERLTALSQENTYDTLSSLLKAPLNKSYNMSWKEVDPNIKSTFTKMKTNIFASYKIALSRYLPINAQDFIDKVHLSYQAIDLLISKGNLLSQFQAAYQARKRELNQLDFSDLERYAHELLKEEHGIVDILYHRLKEIMVDEYQDTNQIQESLLLKIANYKQPSIPLFMVGDMKQSIYRFRQADPQIFLDKYNSYSLNDEECLKTHTRRIDLVFNYRSSKIVLDSINYIFNQIMDTQIGGLEYYLDESARLNYDYVGKENNQKEEARNRFFHDSHLKTELLINIYDPQSSLDKDQYEAHMVAQKIVKLKNEFKINNQPINYKDIVVLMRSTPSFLTFKKVFDLYHIPNHIVLSQGFMNSIEIENMMTFIKAILNPYDDLALLSVLRQPYVCSHIDLQKIALIRKEDKETPLYQQLKESNDEQIMHFIEIFQDLYNDHFNHSPYDLLKRIYEETKYPLFVCHLINGAQRKANLDLFLEYVLQTQQQYPYLEDLYHFLSSSSDIAPAQVSSSQGDAVEFMTIHKSKGLEFPIVFVCNMHKTFNTQDSKNRLMIDKRLGIAMKPRIIKQSENVDEMIVEYDNCYRNIIAKRQLDESINEEMRIFYVALTRASQKLIMSGVIKNIDEITTIQDQLIVNEDPDIIHKGKGTILLYDRLRKVDNYLSWVLAAILRHPDIIEQCLQHDALRERAQKLKMYHFEKQMTWDSTEHAMFSLQLTNDQEIEENIPKYFYQTDVFDSPLQKKYDNYQYSYDTKKTRTLAVTKLQQLADDHFLTLTKEETSTKISAADKGTIIHLLLSYLTFQNDQLSNIIDTLYQEKLIDNQGYEILTNYQDKLQKFLDSPYYSLIQQATHIYKEKKFSYYDQELDQIIHGVFDLVFIVKDKIYVLDYKTDRISLKNTQEDLIGKHKIQLDYYKKVLKEMYHQDIHAIVYYLHINQGVEF